MAAGSEHVGLDGWIAPARTTDAHGMAPDTPETMSSRRVNTGNSQARNSAGRPCPSHFDLLDLLRWKLFSILDKY